MESSRFISEQDKNQEAQTLLLANEMVPVYFTWQMRKNVTEKVFIYFNFKLIYFLH